MTAQLGEVTAQHGEVTAQHGEVTAQHGEVTAQHGEVTAQPPGAASISASVRGALFGMAFETPQTCNQRVRDLSLAMEARPGAKRPTDAGRQACFTLSLNGSVRGGTSVWLRWRTR